MTASSPSFAFNNIPHELRPIKQWLIWRKQFNPKRQKFDKIPHSPISGLQCDANKSENYTTFEQAVKALNRYKLDGIGFAAGNGYIIIDLDDCLIDGQIKPEALAIVKRFNSYTEVTPSGKGLHIIIKADTENITKKNLSITDGEIYVSKGFCTVTGNILLPDLNTIVNHNGLFNEWFNDLYEQPQAQPQGNNFSFQLAQNQLNKTLASNHMMQSVWQGTAKYASNSEAVIGLRTDLLRLTFGNVDLADQLFQQSPLYQTNTKKWDRLATIDYPKALERLKGEVLINIKPQGLIKLLTEQEADQIPDPEWAIDGVIVKHQMTIISGPKGSFKSFIAVHYTMLMAQQTPTLVIAAEDAPGITQRRKAWRKHYNNNNGVIYTSTKAIKPHKEKEVDELIQLIQKLNIGHITYDTVAASTRGLNENTSDMALALEGLERIRDVTGVSMLLIAHESSKQPNGIRGWTGIGDASYVELSIDATLYTARLNNVRTKNAAGQSRSFTLEKCENTLVAVETSELKLDFSNDGSRKKIIDYIKKHEKATFTELKKALQIPDKSLSRALFLLSSLDLVKSLGNRKPWVATEKLLSGDF